MPPWAVGCVTVQHPFVIPDFVGGTPVRAPSSGDPASSIAIHPNTQPGDLIVLSMIGSWSTTIVECDDPRMTELSYGYIGGWRLSGVWVGYATTLDPISISLKTFVQAYGQFGQASLATFRGPENQQLKWNPKRVEFRDVSYTGSAGKIPGLPGYGSGAICVGQFMSGIGGIYGHQNWDRAPIWTNRWGHDEGYVETNFALTDEKIVPEQPGVNWGTDDAIGYTVIGLK